MVKIKHKSFWIIIGSIIAMTHSFITYGAIRSFCQEDYPTQLKSADGVYIGKVIDVAFEGKGTIAQGNGLIEGTWETVTYEVDTVIKGDNAKKIVIRVFNYDSTAVVYSNTIPVEQRSVVFVSKPQNSPGIYNLYKNMPPICVVAKQKTLGLPEGATPSQRLQEEIKATASSGKSSLAVPAINILSQIGNKETIPFIKTLSNEAATDDIATAALTARIQLNDVTAIPSVIDLCESGKLNEEQRTKIGGILQTLQGKDVIPSLLGSLRSKDVIIRRSASYALRNILDNQAIPHLAKCLDDADKEVQYNAIFALSVNIGKSKNPVPSIPEFNDNSNKYTRYWKEWWKVEGAKKFATPE